MRSRLLTFILVFFLSAAVVPGLPGLGLLGSYASADEHHHLMPGEKLGSVSFPTSCAAEVQKPFERGVALLHSFEYEEAENQFKEVAQHDSHCAMAYWGQAMSLFHELWSRPTKDNMKYGHDLIEKARAAKPATARERDYVEALAVLYQEKESLEYHARLDAYAEAMQGVYERNPKDREAAVFYALSLLGSGPEKDPQHTNDRKAVAILYKLFEQQPDHPGIAHYIIHACDNPDMASLGLTAARKYASIAPSSPHAVHMPSHIFARLGLWHDDIQSNTNAIKAADEMAAMHLHVLHHKLHSMDFMEYAYLQIGDDAQAKAQIDQLAKVNKDDAGTEFEGYSQEMEGSWPAVYAVERRQWKEALNLEPIANAGPNLKVVTWWAHAVAAGHLHDAAAAQEALKHYDELLEQINKGSRPWIAKGLENEHQEVQAWSAYAEGKNAEAVRLLRSTADQQDKVGKGETELPAREMLADMLLDMNRPGEALVEYETSLRTDPNRFNGLYGAAQAAGQLHDRKKANRYSAQLLKNCEGVNSDRVELEKVKILMAQK